MNGINFDDVQIKGESGDSNEEYKTSDYDQYVPAKGSEQKDGTLPELEMPHAKTEEELEEEMRKIEEGEGEEEQEEPDQEEEAEEVEKAPEETPEQKLARENAELREKLARAEGAREVYEKSQAKPEEEQPQHLTPVQRIEKDLEEGDFDPKDYHEYNKRLEQYQMEEAKYQEEERAKRAEESAREQKERDEAVAKQVNEIFSENGITDSKDMRKADILFRKWVEEERIQPTVNGLRVVAEYMKAAGQAGSSPEPKGQKNEAGDKKREVNRRISRPNATEGKPGKSSDVVIHNAHQKDLDEIVLEMSNIVDR